MNFIPDANESDIDIPFFEDARSGYAPYYSSNKSLGQAIAQVRNEMAKLGAGVFSFQSGVFGDSPKRHGYQIHFFLGDRKGVIRVAGLPMRKETPKRIEQVKVQALLNVADWLKASVTQQVFSPGAHPLLGKLLTEGGMTVEERFAQAAHQNLLESAEWSED